MSTKDTDFVEHLFVASTHSTMLFTNRGRVFSRKVHLPSGSCIARGKPIINVLPFDSDEKLAMVPERVYRRPLPLLRDSYGRVKKTDLMAYSNIRSTGIMPSS